jgi:hypothetical protein
LLGNVAISELCLACPQLFHALLKSKEMLFLAFCFDALSAEESEEEEEESIHHFVSISWDMMV